MDFKCWQGVVLCTTMVGRTILISGKVQGEGYRQSAKSKAEALGLAGIVKNLPDGRVVAEVEGEAPNVSAFVQWCHQGPTLAGVTRVEIFDTAPKNFAGFKIER